MPPKMQYFQVAGARALQPYTYATITLKVSRIIKNRVARNFEHKSEVT